MFGGAGRWSVNICRAILACLLDLWMPRTILPCAASIGGCRQKTMPSKSAASAILQKYGYRGRSRNCPARVHDWFVLSSSFETCCTALRSSHCRRLCCRKVLFPTREADAPSPPRLGRATMESRLCGGPFVGWHTCFLPAMCSQVCSPCSQVSTAGVCQQLT